MHPQPDLRSRRAESPGPLRWLLVVVVALLIGFVLYVNRVDDEVPDEEVQSLPERELTTAPQRLPQPPAEDIPLRMEAGEELAPDTAGEPAEEGAQELSDLPTLENSDQAVRDRLSGLAEIPLLRNMLAMDMLIQRAVGLIDGLSRGFIPAQILPLPGPSAPFVATMIDGEPYLDTAGYSRYDRVVRWLEGVDVDLLVDAFHRFRPLLEHAYGELGYAEAEMDNALIRALDRIIDTPRLNAPLALQRNSVMYSFADPDLENRNALQKQLLRLGPENLGKIQSLATQLREQLLATNIE